MLSNLKTIKKERNGYGTGFAINYTATAIDENNEWKYRCHDPKPIYGSQLSLIQQYAKSGHTTRFVFAVYDEAGDGTFNLNDKKELHAYYDHSIDAVYATLYYDKNIFEIRREKLGELVQPDAFESGDKILKTTQSLS